MHLDCDKNFFLIATFPSIDTLCKVQLLTLELWSQLHSSHNRFVLNNKQIKKKKSSQICSWIRHLLKTWRPSLKTMVEASLNSLNLFWRKLIDWQVEKSLNNSLQLYSHSRRPHSGFVPTCIAFGKKNVEINGSTWRELKLVLGLYLSTPSCNPQWRRHRLGDQISFCIKISTKTNLTPN